MDRRKIDLETIDLDAIDQELRTSTPRSMATTLNTAAALTTTSIGSTGEM